MSKKSPSARQKVFRALEVVRLAGGDYHAYLDGVLHMDLYAPDDFVWVATGMPVMNVHGSGPRDADWRLVWSLVKQGIRGRDHNV